MSPRISSRKPYLDILRILASFLVCYNHSFGFHLFLDQEADGSLISWVNVVLPILAGANIPLFLMLSGALLLGKEESYKDLFSKRIWRFVVLLFCASAVTYVVLNWGELSLTEFVYAFFSGNINGSYWYLFAYLSLLLMLPFLRKIARHLSGADILFVILLRLIFETGLGILNFCLGLQGIRQITLSSNLDFPLSTLIFLFYPLVGYYLANQLPMDKLKPKHIATCFAILAAGTAISAAMTYVEGSRTGFTQNYLGTFNYTSAFALFIIVRYFVEKITIPDKLCAVLASLSSFTLGIYLLEPLIAHFLYLPFFNLFPWEPVAMTAASVLWALICMTLGGTLTWLLRKIPGVKKYL